MFLHSCHRWESLQCLGHPAKTLLRLKPAVWERVEAEATSLTTYRQNIGILDVGGKPRPAKGRLRWMWFWYDKDLLLKLVEGLPFDRLWILFVGRMCQLWMVRLQLWWLENCNRWEVKCCKSTGQPSTKCVDTFSCCSFFLLGFTSYVYSMVSFYFAGCREEQLVKMLAHFAD